MESSQVYEYIYKANGVCRPFAPLSNARLVYCIAWRTHWGFSTNWDITTRITGLYLTKFLQVYTSFYKFYKILQYTNLHLFSTDYTMICFLHDQVSTSAFHNLHNDLLRRMAIIAWIPWYKSFGFFSWKAQEFFMPLFIYHTTRNFSPYTNKPYGVFWRLDQPLDPR